MRVTSSSTLRQVISIKDLSLIQKTALCSVAGLSGLRILTDKQRYDGENGAPSIVYDLTLEVNTSNKNSSAPFDELVLLWRTMQSLNSGGWLAADSTSEP